MDAPQPAYVVWSGDPTLFVVLQRGSGRYSVTGEPGGEDDGALPKLTLFNLLEDWSLQQAMGRMLRRSSAASGDQRSGSSHRRSKSLDRSSWGSKQARGRQQQSSQTDATVPRIPSATVTVSAPPLGGGGSATWN